MRIVYFSERMEHYRSAYYQQDTITELQAQCDAYVYGPGFSDYDEGDSIADVIGKSGISPDWLIVGHSWLADNPNSPLVKYPQIDLLESNLPRAIILNKEYARLEEKLDYVKRMRFDFAFTHHHDAARYQEETGVNFSFWPFAVDPAKFNYSGEEKIYDLAFSGILQNVNIVGGSDLRARIMRRVFLCGGDLPLVTKPSFAELSIFWNGMPRGKSATFLNRYFRKYQRLNDSDYTKLLAQSKVFLNTTSPAGLIGTRYYECMASKAFVLCEKNAAHDLVFPEAILMEFDGVDDFVDKLHCAIREESLRFSYVEKAYENVMQNHTWEERIKTLIRVLSS